MNLLLGAFVILFVLVILFALSLLAGLVVTLAFRLVPSLGGTVLALTPSDLFRKIHQWQVLRAKRHNLEAAINRPIFVMFARARLGRLDSIDYLCAFKPGSDARFTMDRSEAMRLNYSDRFAIDRVVTRMEDERQSVILVFDNSKDRGRFRRHMDQCSKWLRMPTEIPRPANFKYAPEKNSSLSRFGELLRRT
jgi:hypothetical protein